MGAKDFMQNFNCSPKLLDKMRLPRIVGNMNIWARSNEDIYHGG